MNFTTVYANIVLVISLASSVCFADGVATSPKPSDHPNTNKPASAYETCLEEIRASKIVINQGVQETCKRAEQKGFINEFNQCLKERPSILVMDSRFFEDCLQVSEKGTATIYNQCLKKIAKLNIDVIGERFLNLAYNANFQQCDQLVGCLTQYQNKGLQIGPSAVSNCSARAALSDKRVAAADSTGVVIETQPALCMFDINGQQIPYGTVDEYNIFAKNYVERSPIVHYNAGPCEK